ncbi:MAG: hypothetical protein KC493_14625 [Bacteriovoracaceae bacterium]|nr:hypothetical protein [Bacteriovoracaceae bacterium]
MSLYDKFNFETGRILSSNVKLIINLKVMQNMSIHKEIRKAEQSKVMLKSYINSELLTAPKRRVIKWIKIIRSI